MGLNSKAGFVWRIFWADEVKMFGCNMPQMQA